MALTLSTISAIAGRKGNEYIHEQVNLKCALLAKKGIKKEKCEGQVRIINVQAGGLDSSGVLVGGADYFTAGSADTTQLMVRPVSFLANVSIPIDVAQLVTGKADSIKLVKQHFDLAGKNLAQDLGASMFDSKLATVNLAGSISAGVATATLSDQTRLRVGKKVDFYNPGNTAKLGAGVVTSITRTQDGSAVVAFSGLTHTGSNIDADTNVWLQGSLTPSAGQRFTSLVDIAGTGDLYGTTVSSADWTGYTTGSAVALTLEAMREVCDEVAARSGDEPTHCLMSRLAFQDYEQLHVSNRRYLEGEKMDAFGKNDVMPEFRGRPIIVDDNCPANKIFFINSEKISLGVWKEFGPLTNGSNGQELAEVSQTAYSYLMKVSGMFNLIVDQRNTVGCLQSFTLG